ncbi:HotDog domain-containing protein [Scleroderma yunnanense]
MPEPWQPIYQWPMPDVPKLEECELEEDLFRRRAMDDGIDEKRKELYLMYAAARADGPIAVRRASWTREENGLLTSMFWMQARTGRSERYEAPFQKCILAYIIPGGSDALAMSSTLDHSIWYYDDDFCCEDGLLYVVNCPRAGDGRGVAHGKLYNRVGKFVAVTCQEGVVRADRRGPERKGKL